MLVRTVGGHYGQSMLAVLPLLLLVTLIAGITPVAAAAATAEFPPLSLPVARFTIAGVLLAVTCRAMGLDWRVPREFRKSILLLALLCVPINQAGFLVGIKLSGAAHAGIAYALVPVLIYWVAVVLRGAALSGRMVVASFLSFSGAAAAVWTSRASATSPMTASMLVGDLLLLSAALSWAVYSVLGRNLVQHVGAVPLLARLFLYGSVMHLPIVLADFAWSDLGTFSWSEVTVRGWWGFAYITIITAYLNYLLWYLVISRFDVTRASIVTNSSFLITLLVEWRFHGLVLDRWVAVGSLTLLAGIVLANLRRSPRAAVAAEQVQAADRNHGETTS